MAEILLPQRSAGSGGRRPRVNTPDASDIKQVQVPSDPGVRVPAFGTDIGVGAEQAARGLRAFGEDVRRAEERQSKEFDAIQTRGMELAVDDEIGRELQRRQVEGDPANPKFQTEFETWARQRANDFHSGLDEGVSPYARESSRLALESKINGFTRQAGQISLKAAQDKSLEVIDKQINVWAAQATRYPGEVDAMLDTVDGDDGLKPFAGTMTPQAETAARLKARETIILGAVNGLVAQGKFRDAEALIGSEKYDADLSRPARAAITADIKRGRSEAESEARLALERSQQQTTSDLAIGVGRGERGYADIEAAYQRGLQKLPGGISPETRSRLTLHLDDITRKRGEEAELVARAANAGQGGPPLDPKNDKDKKGLNLLYAETAKGWANLPADQVLDRAVDFSVQKGITPEPVRGMIRGGLRSGNAEQALLASNTLERLRNANPQLLNDFADEDLRLGHMVASSASAGVPAVDALRLAQESLKVPEAERKTREVDYEAQRGKDTATRLASDDRWLKGQLNSMWVSDPDVPPTMRAEFDRQAKDEYIRTGNLEASRRFALDVINRQWGHSDIGPDRRWMKYAPEKFYGVPTLSQSENSAWMSEQLLSDVSANSISEKPLTKDRILLLPDPTRTGRDGAPAYLVSVLGEDGVLYPVTDKKGMRARWVPDWETSKENERRKKAQADEVERLRKARDPASYVPQLP